MYVPKVKINNNKSYFFGIARKEQTSFWAQYTIF
jgi:hypothetical protein